jgi:outer membrane protein OmpA-like peptidoglycan-associated protein
MTEAEMNNKANIEVRVNQLGFYSPPINLNKIGTDTEGTPTIVMKELANTFTIRTKITDGTLISGIENVEVIVLDSDTKDRLYVGSSDNNGNLVITLDRDELFGELNIEIHTWHNDYISKPLFLNQKLLGKNEIVTKNIKLWKVETGKDMAKILELKPIYFEVNGSRINETAKKELDFVADALKDHRQIKIELSSHTDSRGSEQLNYELSNSRAKSASEYLYSKGVRTDQVIYKGYGETKLLNDCIDGHNCDESQHSINRRVEFNIIEVH